MTDKIIERAKWLAQQGLGVYPLNHMNGMLENMPADALRVYTKEDDVEALFRSRPYKGLMAFTGLKQFGDPSSNRYYVVFDVDEESQLENVKAAFGDNLNKCLLEKGTKGIHICFFTDTQVKTMREKTTVFGDILGATKTPNIVFMAPSISNKNGQEYTIIEDRKIGFIPSTELFNIYDKLKLLNKEEKTEAAYSVAEGPVAEIKIKTTPEMMGLHFGANLECPFHKHSNAKKSLHVTMNDDGSFFWYCYADDDGGDCLKAYMILQKCDFVKALHDLADKTGVELASGARGYSNDQKMVDEWARSRGESLRGFFVRSETETEEITMIKEAFVYTNRGAYILTYMPTKEGGIKKTYSEIIRGDFSIDSKVEYLHDDSTTYKWKITINNNEYTDEIEKLVEYIMSTGSAVGLKEFSRQFISMAIRSSNVKVQKTYQAAGLYWDPITKKIINASTTANVFPSTDSQTKYLNESTKFKNMIEGKDEKAVLQASYDMVRAMPKFNHLPALVARGFSLLAPLGYEIRKSMIGVFPYLYLYGPKGSSKTHMADCCSTLIYGGAGNHLNSNSVGSQFRLGMEFAATTFPRNIDEAHDLFVKNLEIFKDAATSTLATKRGGTNMKMTTYPAYASFILTSNGMPIDSEADVGGGMMDRIIVLKMDKGKEFNQQLYSTAHMKIHTHGMLLGDIFIRKMKDIIDTIGMEQFSTEVIRSAQEISAKSGIPIRRATCIAEMVIGAKLYLRILADNDINFSECFDQSTVQDEIVESMSLIHKESEKDFIRPFLDWIEATIQSNIFRTSQDVQYSYGKIQLDGLDLGAKNETVIITKLALMAYAKRYNYKVMNIKTLPELSDELMKVGYTNVDPAAHKTAQGATKHGIRIPRNGPEGGFLYPEYSRPLPKPPPDDGVESIEVHIQKHKQGDLA